MLGPAFWSQQPQATLQVCEGVSEKLPDGRGSWCTDGQSAEHEPTVCPGGQEGQWHPGLYQEWCGEQDWGNNPGPALSTGEAPAQVLFSFEHLSTERT